MKVDFFLLSNSHKYSAAKLSIAEFYQVPNKLHQADQGHRHPERLAAMVQNRVSSTLDSDSGPLNQGSSPQVRLLLYVLLSP